MSFYRGRDWSDSDRSEAEDIVQKDLQTDGLARGLCTNIGIPFTREEIESSGVFGTFVDGIWTLRKGTLVYFLDGVEVHSKRAQRRRDDAIDTVLADRGIRVIRHPYKPPISKTSRYKFLETVEEELRALGYFGGGEEP